MKRRFLPKPTRKEQIEAVIDIIIAVLCLGIPFALIAMKFGGLIN